MSATYVAITIPARRMLHDETSCFRRRFSQRPEIRKGEPEDLAILYPASTNTCHHLTNIQRNESGPRRLRQRSPRQPEVAPKVHIGPAQHSHGLCHSRTATRTPWLLESYCSAHHLQPKTPAETEPAHRRTRLPEPFGDLEGAAMRARSPTSRKANYQLHFHQQCG